MFQSQRSSDASLFRNATLEDAEAICSIYNPYVLGTPITFEEEAISAETMRTRIAEITAMLPWLIMEQEGELAGYAYATGWKARPAYRYSVETTIYLSPRFHRRGLGTKLYRALIEELRKRGIHRAIGGVVMPNPNSVALHERLGFKKVAHFEEVGWKLNQWRDVGYWQLSL